jgi:hypothetical protein
MLTDLQPALRATAVAANCLHLLYGKTDFRIILICYFEMCDIQMI